MPTPLTTPRPELDALVNEFDITGNSAGFVGLQIMPLQDTVQQSGVFPALDGKSVLSRADDRRQARGGYNRIDFGWKQDNFACNERGLEAPVDEALAKIYASYLDAEMEAQKIVLYKQLVEQEFRIRDIVYTETDNDVGTPWSTSASASPRDDILDASDTIRNRCGLRPNSLQLTLTKFRQILRTAEFLDIAKFTGNPFTLGLEAQKRLVADYLEVPNIIIAEGVYDSADEGQDINTVDIWDDTVGFLFIQGFGLMGGPKYGLTMNWAADSLIGTESYYEEQTRSNIIRVRHWRDEKVVLNEAGFKLTSL